MHDKVKSTPDGPWERYFSPALLTATVAVLLLCGLVIYRNLKVFAETATWVSHTHEVIGNVEGIQSSLTEAESSARGFWITGEEEYRAQFDRATAKTTRLQSDLKQLTSDDLEQQSRLGDLQKLIEPVIVQQRQFMTTSTNASAKTKSDASSIGNATVAMQPVRSMIESIRSHEDELLRVRSADYDANFRQSWLTLLLSAAVLAGLLSGIYYVLQRHWKLQEQSAKDSASHARERGELLQYNERLLESTGEGIYGIDREGQCTFINRAGALLLKYRREEVLGQDVHALIHHTDSQGQPYPLANCPIFKAFRTGGGCQVDNEVFWRSDNTSFPVEYTSFPIRNEGEIEGAVITFKDITIRLRAIHDLEDAKKAAEIANESKSQFLANMSHELRTPLNAVIMYSELLAEEAVDANVPDFVPDLNRIRSAGKHLLELVNGVLDLSKIEAGKMELYRETFQVTSLVEEVVSTIGPLIEKNRNRIEVSIDQDVDTMDGDVTKLRQVLFNLLSNASKFTENGVISLKVGKDDTWMIFKVTDTGIGMNPEQLSRLFQPFMQADASTTRKYGGTGLGLAIIRRFTDLMGGEVSVESALGRGSTFTIKLPLMLGDAPVEKEGSVERLDSVSKNATPSGSTGNAIIGSILVIDDDPAVRDVLSRVLVNEGIQCITAADGAEGLRMAYEHFPDLIILDVNMPKIDGWSVLLTLKADEYLADIPVIMQSIGEDRDMGFVLGASEYLVKPVDRVKLVSLLRRYLLATDSSILVVDDDETIRRALDRTLRKQGWRILQAGDGAEALEQIARERPALILLDLMMPVMDGLEFLEHLHDHDDWKTIPVVVLTAKELTDEDRHRLNGGIEKVLIKGTSSHQRLLDEVRRVVATVTDKPSLGSQKGNAVSSSRV